MAQTLVSRIGASPLWRAGLASAFILGLAGFAAGVIPQACRSAFVICQANAPGGEILAPLDGTILPEADAPIAEPAAEAPRPVEQASTAVAAIDTAMQARQPAALTRNDLIAQTFAALDFELVATPGELTARKVRTVAIGPDGMPIVANDPPQIAAAEPAPVELTADEPVAVELQVAEARPAPVVEEPVEEEPSAAAYAPVQGGNAIVGRQGANVRSQPQTRGSEVLFALASGDEVTVTQTSKGWSKVVDSRGRSGWVWNDLLRR